jgi:hypothetical protein
MKKIIFFCTLLYALLIMAAPVKAGAFETEEAFGIVLDAEGNGLLLDPVTWKPIHPYYNYISYKGLVTKPGQFMVTYEILNRYGEVEEREDYYADLPIATPEKLAEFNLLANRGIYELDGVITEIDKNNNQIIFVTVDGNEWFDYGIENLHVNQRVRVVLYDNGTSNQHDDQIMQIQYWR